MINLLAAVSLQPTSGFGSSELQSIANELAGAVIILALIGLVVGAGLKALGGGTGNQILGDKGGLWMKNAGIAAIAVGAAAVFINFALKIGGSIH